VSGFYPAPPKVFVVKQTTYDYEIIDTRTGKVVAHAPNGKDARYLCGLKNNACW